MQVLLAIVVLGLSYLILWPIDMNPIARDFAKPPAQTDFVTEDTSLTDADRIVLPDGAFGPEDLAVVDGKIYTTDHDGGLYEVRDDAAVKIADLGGRPLGLDGGPDGRLYIADSYRGLMRWTPDLGLELLAGRVDGAPITYANQLDVARDGTVYFSNSTDRFDPEPLNSTLAASVMTIWEQSESGYVARRAPDGTIDKIAEGFVFTNGVALSPDEDFLLVVETGRARIVRVWLATERFGTSEVFMDNLPGYPDNLEPVGDGTYWVGFASPRLSSEALMPYPFLRKVIWRLGPMVRPAPIREGRVMRFDGAGNVLENYFDPTGGLGITTGVVPAGDQLFVTSLDGDALGRLPLRAE